LKIDRNYYSAVGQVTDKVREAIDGLCVASCEMVSGHPGEAHNALKDARAAVDGAMVAAKWAESLPLPED
jgi:hypothetical protein